MKKGRIHKSLEWLLVFAFVCSSVFVTTGNAEEFSVSCKFAFGSLFHGNKFRAGIF
ncbi:MAG: hypothetical protein K2I10_09460 [Lachnospiraceae bacterium]|nr:hypothetical protein [Lachnospiraceae bacterium]